VTAYNLDIPLASLALYQHLLLVILSPLSISMAYMTSGWISVDAEDMVPWHNNYFVSLQLPTILTLLQRFALYINFNSLVLNPNVLSMNFTKPLLMSLITPCADKLKFV
jgi:hypothetical protein